MAHFYWLYRPTVPTVRAQSIQTLQAAHAMARRGHKVRISVEGIGTPEDILAWHGLAPHENFHLNLLPRGRTLASVSHRVDFAQWVHKAGPSGIVIARSKRYARLARKWLGQRFHLVVEAHEVDSKLADERGWDADEWRQIETEVLGEADAVVANAPGTLQLLEETYDLPPSVVLHNASALAPGNPDPDAKDFLYVGSLRPYKDRKTLEEAAALLDRPITVVGGGTGAITHPNLVRLPAVPPRDVGNVLRRARVLLLPLSRGLFGERLTSPMKLWDYLASGVPFVGADLPSLHEAAPDAFEPYQPGDPESLADAVRRLDEYEGLRERRLIAAKALVRTWDDRAKELEDFLVSIDLLPPSERDSPPKDSGSEEAA